MPTDPKKLRKSYIKKASSILRLTPEKQEKAKKKLKQRLEEKKAHVGKLDKEVQLYTDRDEKGLVAYAKSLQKKAKEEGRGEKISDFRVPVPLSEFKKKGYAKLPHDKQPSILRKDKTLDQWWQEQVKALEEKQTYEQADRDNLFEDNRTLLELEIDDLEQQNSVIGSLTFKNRKQHFGHEQFDEKRFNKIIENNLYRINYKLDELQANHKKLTGKKHVKKTD